MKSKITDCEAGVGYNNGVLLEKKTNTNSDIMNDTPQFSRAMTVAVTKKEHEKADMIARKKAFKRKLTVTVKADPALEADAKVGWSIPVDSLAKNNENQKSTTQQDSAEGLNRTHKIVFGSVAAVVCLIHAYMIYKRS